MKSANALKSSRRCKIARKEETRIKLVYGKCVVLFALTTGVVVLTTAATARYSEQMMFVPC